MTRQQPIFAGFGVFLFFLACGCESTQTVTIGPYAHGDRPVIRQAPESGFYKVQWLSADRRETPNCAGSKRLIVRGEPVGFTTGPDGQVIAIAGIEKFPLQQPPDGARYCQWHFTYRRETGLGRALDRAGDAADQPAAVAAELGAAVVADHAAESGWDGVDHGHPARDDSHKNDDHGHDHSAPRAPTSRGSD